MAFIPAGHAVLTAAAPFRTEREQSDHWSAEIFPETFPRFDANTMRAVTKPPIRPFQATSIVIGPSSAVVVGCRHIRPWASTTAMAVMLRMPRAVVDGVRMCAGLSAPMRIGPIDRASVITLVSW